MIVPVMNPSAPTTQAIPYPTSQIARPHDLVGNTTGRPFTELPVVASENADLFATAMANERIGQGNLRTKKDDAEGTVEFVKNGSGGRVRTYDLVVNSHPLYR